MVARTYDKLGGIGGIQTNEQAPYSLRGVDRDRFQNFVFECNSDAPFTGVILVEISQDDPSRLTTNAQGRLAPDTSQFTWTAIGKLEFIGERDDIFVEFQLEAAHIRVRSISYNSNAIVSTNPSALVGGTGAQQFTIDGTTVVVNAADDLATVKAAIDAATIPGIVTSIDNTSQTLHIEQTNGNAMLLADTVGTPLQDLGVLRVGDSGTYTANANGRIIQIKTMR